MSADLDTTLRDYAERWRAALPPPPEASDLLRHAPRRRPVHEWLAIAASVAVIGLLATALVVLRSSDRTDPAAPTGIPLTPETSWVGSTLNVVPDAKGYCPAGAWQLTATSEKQLSTFDSPSGGWVTTFGSSPGPYLKIAMPALQFGDVSGDGAADAVVLGECFGPRTGGDTGVMGLVVRQTAPGSLEVLFYFPAGPTSTVTVDAGWVTVVTPSAGTGRYRWVNGQVDAQSSPPPPPSASRPPTAGCGFVTDPARIGGAVRATFENLPGDRNMGGGGPGPWREGDVTVSSPTGLTWTTLRDTPANGTAVGGRVIGSGAVSAPANPIDQTVGPLTITLANPAVGVGFGVWGDGQHAFVIEARGGGGELIGRHKVENWTGEVSSAFVGFAGTGCAVKSVTITAAVQPWAPHIDNVRVGPRA